MKLHKHRGQMSESLLTAAFIILSGGLQDAYTSNTLMGEMMGFVT